MNFFFPVIALVLQAGSFALDKIILNIRGVGYRTYTGISYPLIFYYAHNLFYIPAATKVVG